jgi:hypothetical protein
MNVFVKLRVVSKLSTFSDTPSITCAVQLLKFNDICKLQTGQFMFLYELNISYDINHLMWLLAHIAFGPAINVTRYYHTKLYLPAVADRDGIGS